MIEVIAALLGTVTGWLLNLLTQWFTERRAERVARTLIALEIEELSSRAGRHLGDPYLRSSAPATPAWASLSQVLARVLAYPQFRDVCRWYRKIASWNDGPRNRSHAGCSGFAKELSTEGHRLSKLVSGDP